MAADEEDVSMPNQNPAGEAIYDARALGVKAPVNLSGDLAAAGDVYIVGEEGLLPAPGSGIAAPASSSRRAVRTPSSSRVSASYCSR